MAKTRGKSVTDGTEKKLRNLKPFKPGQSGNPKGRPRAHAIAWAQRLDFTKFGTQAHRRGRD